MAYRGFWSPSSDCTALTEITSPDPLSKGQEEGLGDGSGAVLEGGVGARVGAKPGPAGPVFCAELCVQRRIGNRAPRSVEIMLEATPGGGAASSQDCVCNGKREAKVGRK